MRGISRLLVIAMVLVMVVSGLVACSTPTPAPGTAPQPAAYKWPNSMSIAIHAVGETVYQLTAAWTPVLEQSTGMRVRLVPETIPAQKRNMLRAGEVDFLSESISTTASDGLEITEQDVNRDGGPFPIRLTWSASNGYLGFMVRGDSDIKTIYDVKKGVKLASRDTPANILALQGFLAWAKLKPEDGIIVKVPTAEAQVQAVVDGKADVCYTGTTGAVVFEAQAAPKGIRFIPIDASKDPDGAKRFLEYRPTLQFGPMEIGVKEAVGVWGVRAPTPYFGHADKTSVELVYNTDKWIDQNYDSYKAKHDLLIGMSFSSFRNLADSTFIPIHDGTIRYLKEKGQWSAKDQARQDANVALVNRYIEAFKAAVAMADSKKITVDSKSKEFMTLWTEYKKTNNIPAFKVTL